MPVGIYFVAGHATDQMQRILAYTCALSAGRRANPAHRERNTKLQVMSVAGHPTACPVHSVYYVALSCAAADTQDEVGRERSIVDGLVLVTQRAWGLASPTPERNDDPEDAQ